MISMEALSAIKSAVVQLTETEDGNLTQIYMIPMIYQSVSAVDMNSHRIFQWWGSLFCRIAVKAAVNILVWVIHIETL